MDPAAFVEVRRKRCLAQSMEEFERRVEKPLKLLAERKAPVEPHRLRELLYDIDLVKRTFRKQIQALAADCLDLMPSDMEINAFEPVARR